jgi:hypothetical protein
MSHRLFAGREASIAVSTSEDLEEGDGVLGGFKEGFKPKGFTEVCPNSPVCICCVGTARYNSGAHRCLHSAKVVAESMTGRAWHKVHVSFCG